MNFLPVAQRELRLLARAPSTYRIRVLTALLAILLSIAMLYAGFVGALSAATAGREVFVALSLAAGLYVTLEGAFATGDCLSREKREGTLGLLFLTDLRGYDIVAGKLISRTGRSAYAIAAALPTLGVSLFLGGVTGREFALMMLALLNGLFFSASWGMLVSAIFKEERAAVGIAVIGAIGIAFLLPWAGWLVSQQTLSGAVHPACLMLSPAGAFLEVLEAGPGTGAWSVPFGKSWLWTHATAWAFLGAASLSLPRAWRTAGVAEHGFFTRLGRFLSREKGCSAQVAGCRRATPDLMLFMDQEPLPSYRRGNDLAGSGWKTSTLLFLLAVWTLGLALVRSRWISLPGFALFSALLDAGMILIALLVVCRRPADDQRNGTLELLLTTPRGEEFYLRGRMLSCKRWFAGPVLFLSATELGIMMAGCFSSGSLNWEWLVWFALAGVTLVKVLLDLYAIAWVGLWQALKVGRTGRAIRHTIFYLFITKWVLVLTIPAVTGILTRGKIFDSPAGAVALAIAYLFATLAIPGHYCAAAMSELTDNLRGFALGLPAPAPVGKARETWLAVRNRIRRVGFPRVRPHTSH